LSFRLESPIHAPKFQFWGDFPPKKFRDTSFRPEKDTSMRGTTRFEPSLIQIWRTVRLVALAKKTKKDNITGYSSRPPTSPYRSQRLRAGWPPVCSSIDQVLLKSVQWFCRCKWSKIALSHYFGNWLIQQLVGYYRTIDPEIDRVDRSSRSFDDGVESSRLASEKSSRSIESIVRLWSRASRLSTLTKWTKSVR